MRVESQKQPDELTAPPPDHGLEYDVEVVGMF